MTLQWHGKRSGRIYKLKEESCQKNIKVIPKRKKKKIPSSCYYVPISFYLIFCIQISDGNHEKNKASIQRFELHPSTGY